MEAPSPPPFPLAVFVSGAPSPLEGQGTELQPEGVFFSFEGELPALFTPVRVRLKLPDGEIECDGEVVRVVTPEQAARWQMPICCGIQFVHASSSLEQAINRANARWASARHPPDAELQRLLTDAEQDHYKLLGLKRDADLSVAWRRAKDCRRKLEEAAARRIDAGLLEPALERVDHAGRVLGDPLLRAEYDALLSNFRGVARCIRAGLTPQQLDACRKRFLTARPSAAANALARVTVARLNESIGKPEEAFENLEQALSLDPLNLKLHLAWARAARLQQTRWMSGAPVRTRAP